MSEPKDELTADEGQDIFREEDIGQMLQGCVPTIIAGDGTPFVAGVGCKAVVGTRVVAASDTHREQGTVDSDTAQKKTS